MGSEPVVTKPIQDGSKTLCSNVPIGVYYGRCFKRHRLVLQAFFKGLQAHGEHCVFERLRKYDAGNAPSLSVQYGVYKPWTLNGRGKQRVVSGQATLGRPWMVLERGFVRRDRYYAAGWEGLNGRADFCNRNMPGDRFDALGMALQPWRPDGDHILLCGQVRSDASVAETNHLAWLEATARQLKHYTNRPIHFRPHPLNRRVKLRDVPSCRHRSLSEALRGAWACITYSSNSAVEAAVLGYPVFAFDQGSMAYPIANKSLSLIENPTMPDRQQWAQDLAYTQWTLAEFEQGHCWQHLRQRWRR